MTATESKTKNRVGFVLPALGVAWLLLAALIIILQIGSAPTIEIAWVTATEFETAGFNVWRSDSPQGVFNKVNDQLIPASPDAATGAEYRFVDEEIDRNKTYFYRLEDVAFDNRTVQHEIISASATGTSPVLLGLAIVCALVGAGLIVSSVIGRNR